MKTFFLLLTGLLGISLNILHAQVPTNGLVAYYPFNGDANDESGNGNDGAVYGATVTIDRFGNANTAYSFDGLDNYINTNLNTGFTDQFSISFWVKSSNTNDFTGLITSRGGEGGMNGFSVFPEGNICFYAVGTGDGYVLTTSVNILDNHWHFITGTYNGSEAKLYIDNLLVGTSICSGNVSVGDFYKIGKDDFSNDRFLNGDLDDIRFYDRALNEAEIQALYNEPAPIADIDGNVYNTVTIGSQTWMRENLKTTKYNDGTDIPLVTDGGTWAGLSTPAYCWYNNEEVTNKNVYGGLYNWYSVNTGKLCPFGYHVPTDAEWTILTDYLGGEAIAGGKLKEAGFSHWKSPNTGATNETGFTALPAGIRAGSSYFFIGIGGRWWTSSETDETNAWDRSTHSDASDVMKKSYNKAIGFSVRCVKNTEHKIALPTLITIVGESFEVAVGTSELTSTDNIIAYQFDYNYDTSKLEYIASSVAGTLAEGGSLEVNPTPGKLSIAWANSTAITGKGAILKLQFKSLSKGETSPAISNALYNTTPVTAVNGVITSINKYGDIDDNENVQAYDASLAIQYSVGLDPIPAIDALPWENWRIITANVDGAGSITANDASEILKYTVGLITQFPVETGKKSASASIADVTVGVVNNDIVFYSGGELFGLNISTTNTNQILGTPEVLTDNFMSAFNISGTTYNLGLCTAYSPEDGAAIMKIPFSKNGSVTFNMIVNTVSKELTIDLVTGIAKDPGNNINIYPNPVRDKLMISGLNEAATAGIYNTNGKLLLTSKIKTLSGEIDVAGLPVGVYVIKLQTDKEIAVKRFVVK